MTRYDIAIIGTGPAGLEAAITAKVRNKKYYLIWFKGLEPKDAGGKTPNSKLLGLTI